MSTSCLTSIALLPPDKTVSCLSVQPKFFKANNAYHHNLIDSYISWALNMPSKLVILLPQDILHEGTKRRINKPSIVDNENWTYRLNSFTKLRRALRKDIYKY